MSKNCDSMSKQTFIGSFQRHSRLAKITFNVFLLLVALFWFEQSKFVVSIKVDQCRIWDVAFLVVHVIDSQFSEILDMASRFFINIHHFNVILVQRSWVTKIVQVCSIILTWSFDFVTWVKLVGWNNIWNRGKVSIRKIVALSFGFAGRAVHKVRNGVNVAV